MKDKDAFLLGLLGKVEEYVPPPPKLTYRRKDMQAED
jgi:hypothetical protein